MAMSSNYSSLRRAALKGWSFPATTSRVTLSLGIVVTTQPLPAVGAAAMAREPTITTPALGTFLAASSASRPYQLLWWLLHRFLPAGQKSSTQSVARAARERTPEVLAS